MRRLLVVALHLLGCSGADPADATFPGRNGVLSANGQIVDARTIQNISVTLRGNGSFTVAFVGTDFRLPVGARSLVAA